MRIEIELNDEIAAELESVRRESNCFSLVQVAQECIEVVLAERRLPHVTWRYTAHVEGLTAMTDTKDAVEILLESRPHPTAEKLLDFHRRNSTFFAAFAAEFLWLKKRRRPGAAKALLMFLRGADRWQGVDEFMVNDHLFPLLSRICILLYPTLYNGTLKMHQCEADAILGTSIDPRGGKKKGMVLHAGNALSLEIAKLPPTPELSILTKRSKRHRTVTPDQSSYVLPFIKDFVAGSPHPESRPAIACAPCKSTAEIFALAEMTMRSRLAKRLHHFSVLDFLNYGAQTAKLTATKKRFTLPSQIEGLYCRAVIHHNPQFNVRLSSKRTARETTQGPR